jgi:uncharacterized protein
LPKRKKNEPRERKRNEKECQLTATFLFFLYLPKMVPRPKLKRKIHFNPDVTYFKPRGIPLKKLEEVILSADELEALRLKNFLDLDQNDAAEKLGVSQPTFHRTLLSANKKVTEALIKGKAIRIEN